MLGSTIEREMWCGRLVVDISRLSDDVDPHIYSVPSESFSNFDPSRFVILSPTMLLQSYRSRVETKFTIAIANERKAVALTRAYSCSTLRCLALQWGI
jgi:hypothetical protein